MTGNKVTAEFVMPCGHKLQASWIKRVSQTMAIDSVTQPENYEDQILAAADMLHRWLMTRAARHSCTLVTDDNPFGQPRSN